LPFVLHGYVALEMKRRSNYDRIAARAAKPITARRQSCQNGHDMKTKLLLFLSVLFLAESLSAVQLDNLVLKDSTSSESLATTEGAKTYIAQFLQQLDSTVMIQECSAFIEKKFDGLYYLVAKALVTVNGAQQVRGIVIDEATKWASSLSEQRYNSFLQTGDRNYLAKIPNLDPNVASSTPLPNATPAPQRIPQPTSPPSVAATELDYVLTLTKIFDTWDWAALTQFTADGELYYFGHRSVSDSYIRNDMINDRATYSWSRTATVNSSLRTWVDNGLYFDSIEQYTSVMERSGKLHRAHTIFTVGRANDGKIYFLNHI